MSELVVVHPVTGAEYTRQGRLGDAIVWRRDGAIISSHIAAREIAHAFDAREALADRDYALACDSAA